jgi:hypothetical protein
MGAFQNLQYGAIKFAMNARNTPTQKSKSVEWLHTQNPFEVTELSQLHNKFVWGCANYLCSNHNLINSQVIF